MPQLWPLLLWVPSVLSRTDREHALFGTRLLFIATCPTEGEIESVLVDRLLEPLGLPHVGVHGRPMIERVDALLDTLRILVHQQVHANAVRHAITELIHLMELPCGVNVQQRKRRQRRRERLDCEMQHHCAVFTDRIQHCGTLALRDSLAKYLNALGFKPLQVG